MPKSALERQWRLPLIFARELVRVGIDRRANPVPALRHYAAWRGSVAADPLELGLPWLSFGAIEVLEEVVSSAARVFEYGSGGSTLFFARRAGQVVSVEHDAGWFDALAPRRPANVEALLRPPGPGDIARFGSSDAVYDGLSFEMYARAIDSFPDRYFDVVLIDGRARVGCFRQAREKVRPGGLLVLDNTERPTYAEAVAAARAAGWQERRYPGPFPYMPWFSETTIWTVS